MVRCLQGLLVVWATTASCAVAQDARDSEAAARVSDGAESPPTQDGEPEASPAEAAEEAELTLLAPAPAHASDSQPLSQAEYQAEFDSIIYGIGGWIILGHAGIGAELPPMQDGEPEASPAEAAEEAELTLLAPAPAHASDSQPLSQAEYQAELDSINSESMAATVVYGIGGGIILLAPLVGFAIPTGRSAGGIRVGGDFGYAILFGVAGAGLSLFVLFPIAIGLDVDSGSRRGALEARRPEGVELTSVSVAPTEGGAVLQLGGRF